jgi:hypothetical protein
MLVTLKKSGGLLGAPRPPIVVDTASLSINSKRRLEALVQDCRFFELPETVPTSAPQPDRLQYTLEIRDASNRLRTVTFSEGSGPESLTDLARTIQEVARSG